MNVTRREALLGGVGVMTAGLTGGYFMGHPEGQARGLVDAELMDKKFPFRGTYQPGILTPAQQNMQLVSYRILTTSRKKLVELLKSWTSAAEAMMSGQTPLSAGDDQHKAPGDTGEAYDLGPYGLTVTFGFGASMFEDADGNPRFGLDGKKPETLIHQMRKVAGDFLQEERCGGDLMIMACAEDPTVAIHAIHMFTKLGFGLVTVKWLQSGYAGTFSSAGKGHTPRNIFGFRDGTQASQLREDEEKLYENVWIHPEDPGGDLFANGSFFCIRRIRLMVEVWDNLILSEQERAFGRAKLSGGPLSGGEEFDEVDYEAVDEAGNLLVPKESHQHAVGAATNNDRTMLRRSYSYMEGIDRLGNLDAGLAFIAYARDPNTNFVDIMEKMQNTLLLEYMKYEGSAVFLCPPGLGEGEEFIGQALFAE